MVSSKSFKTDITIEFLEVAIHAILYVRKMYPSTIFTLKKKYGIPVRISTHPKVNDYIGKCLKTIKELIGWNCVQNVCVVIWSKEVPLERHIFDFLREEKNADEYFVQAEEAFRDYLLKLSVVELTLPAASEDKHFSIEIATNSKSSVKLNEGASVSHFPWVQSVQIYGDESEGHVVPIKTLNTQNMTLQMYIERFKQS